MALVITALHDVSGGAERVLVDVANGLHERGFPVTVMTYQDRNGPSFYPLDYGIVRVDGKPRHDDRSRPCAPERVSASISASVPSNRMVGSALWLARYGRKVFHVRRLLQLTRPDVAIGFLPSSFPYLELAATGTGVKTVASIHNVPAHEFGGDPERWDQNPVDIAVRRRALRTSDANTVPLRSFVDELEPSVRHKTYVLPNPVRARDGVRADVSDDDADSTVLAVGRLSPAKDHATLIRAWSRLEAEHVPWRLRIIGDGRLRDDLLTAIRELGLQRVVIDPPTRDIETAFAAAKFLVMPSRHEGFGLVTAEAMACGLPVIGFADCAGTNELIVDGVNGLLVDPGDDRAVALAGAMRRLMGDEVERRQLGAAAPRTLGSYEPTVVIDAWEGMIHDVANGSVPR